MSGLTSALAKGVGVVDLAGSILFGSDGPVIVGSVALKSFEVPESITWGGAQRTAVHRLPGGARVIDAMGRDDHDITWSGICLGADAESRALALDQIRVAGQPVPLSWGTHYFQVVVTQVEFESKFEQVPYRITCQVIADQSFAPGPDFISTALQVVADVGQAVDSVAGIFLAPAGVTFPTYSTAATAQNAAALAAADAQAAAAALAFAVTAAATAAQSGFTIGASTTLAAVQAIEAADAAIETALQDAGTTLAAVAADAPEGALTGTLADLAAAIGAAGVAAQAAAAGGFVGRARLNAQGGAV